MEITIESKDVIKYGLPHCYFLGYIKAKENKFTIKEAMAELDYSESNVRQQLNTMEQYGLIKRYYQKGQRGRDKLIGAEVLV